MPSFLRLAGLRRLTRWASVAALAFAAIPCSLAAQTPQYNLVWLDELGGAHIMVDGDVEGAGLFPPSINNSGVAVGGASTSIPVPSSPVIDNPYVVPNPTTIAAVAWQGTVAINLGTLPGGYYSFANNISNSGLVAGISEMGKLDPRLGVLQVHPTLWAFGVVIDLGTFGGGEGYANMVNDFGQVVGYAQNDKADAFDYFGLGTQSRAFLWQYGQLIDLGTLGGSDSQAEFINDSGQIAGVSYTGSTAVNTGPSCNAGANVPPQHPFFWENGKMLDIGTLGGNCAWVAGLNNRGQVAGNSTQADINADPHAFLWSRETGMQELATLPGAAFTQADGINDAGEVIGTACTAGDEACYAVLWKNGTLTNLGTLPGDCGSDAYEINSKGQIVGTSNNCVTGIFRSFLWENGQMYTFSDVAPGGAEILYEEPIGINDNGEIFVSTITTAGFHPYLLIPCGQPEEQKCENVTTK